MLLEDICLQPDEPHYHQQQSECKQVLGVKAATLRGIVRKQKCMCPNISSGQLLAFGCFVNMAAGI